MIIDSMKKLYECIAVGVELEHKAGFPLNHYSFDGVVRHVAEGNIRTKPQAKPSPTNDRGT